MKDKSQPPRHDPWDVECEQAALGGLLVNNRLIDQAAIEITPDLFYDPLHQRLFDTILKLSADGPVTPLVVNSFLKSDPGYGAVGGMNYLVGLVGGAPALPNISRLATILRDHAVRRQLIRIGEGMAASAHAPPSEFPAR